MPEEQAVEKERLTEETLEERAQRETLVRARERREARERSIGNLLTLILPRKTS